METQSNSQSGQPIDIAWTGKGSNYVGLGFKIFLLKIITLGIYHFWAKTEIRKRLWNNVRINNEPLEYTGTGMELFLGFLVVMFAVFLPAILLMFGLQFMFGPESIEAIVGVLCIYIFFIYLIGVAIYNANRYRLSRTQWRGIRGSLKGSAWGYGWTTFWTTIVSILTLGLAVPWQSIKLQRIITNNTHFGETPMNFTGNYKPLMKYYILPWIAALGGYGLMIFLLFPIFARLAALQKSGEIIDPATTLSIQFQILGYIIVFALVLSIVYAWYQSKYYNYIAEHTKFSNGSFALTTTPVGLIWITVSNFFIVILSLTILSPVAIARLFGYFVQNLSFNGNVDITSIEQSQVTKSKTGEGLAEGFDVSSF